MVGQFEFLPIYVLVVRTSRWSCPDSTVTALATVFAGAVRTARPRVTVLKLDRSGAALFTMFSLIERGAPVMMMAALSDSAFKIGSSDLRISSTWCFCATVPTLLLLVLADSFAMLGVGFNTFAGGVVMSWSPVGRRQPRPG